MTRAQRRRARSSERFFSPLNNGHDVGELVRAADPDTGNATAHAVNRTQTVPDRLHHAGLIDTGQWHQCERVRAVWAAARPIPGVRAADLDAYRISGTIEHVPAEGAEHELRRMMRAAGVLPWAVLLAAVESDIDPRQYGARRGLDGLGLFKAALNALEAV